MREYLTLITTIRQLRQPTQTPEALLRAALPLIVTTLELRAAALYRLAPDPTGETLTPWFIQPDGAAIAFTEAALHEAFAATDPIMTAMPAGGALVPLNPATGPRHLLALVYDEAITVLPDALYALQAALLLALDGLTSRKQTDERNKTVRIPVIDQQTRLLQMLNDLNASANALHDEDMLLTEAAAVLREAAQVDHVSILLLNPDRRTATVRGDAPNSGILNQQIPTADPIWAALRGGNEPVVVLNVTEDARIQAGSRPIFDELGVQSSFLLPVLDADDGLRAVACFDMYMAVDSFSPFTLDLTRSTLTQIVLIWDRLQLLTRTQRQNNRMQTITVFSQAIQGTLETGSILQTTLEGVSNILDYDYIAVHQYHRPSDTLRRVAFSTGTDININLNGDLTAPQTDRLAALAWQNRAVLQVDDMTADDDDWPHPLEGHIRSGVAVPLISGSVYIGLMEMAAVAPYAYSTPDVTAFRQVANQVALALANAATYERSRQQAHHKALTDTIASRLQQQTDLDSILEITVSELGRALGARHGRIRLNADSTPDIEPQE